MEKEISIYLMIAGAGAIAGFARFLRSERKWKPRTVISSSLVGSLLSVSVIGWWAGSKVAENPWGYLGIAIAIGFVQPKFTEMLQYMLGKTFSDKTVRIERDDT